MKRLEDISLLEALYWLGFWIVVTIAMAMIAIPEYIVMGFRLLLEVCR